MKQARLAAALLLGLAACGGPSAPPAPAPNDATRKQEPAPDPRPAGPSGAMEVNLYDVSAGDGGEQRPVFTMRSPQFTLTPDGKHAARDAEAVIYGRPRPDGTIEADTHLEFGDGAIDLEAGTAELRGGVVLTRGGMTIECEDLRWNNTSRTVETAQPVQLSAGQTAITASSMVYDLEAGHMVLREMRGTYDAATTEFL